MREYVLKDRGVNILHLLQMDTGLDSVSVTSPGPGQVAALSNAEPVAYQVVLQKVPSQGS